MESSDKDAPGVWSRWEVLALVIVTAVGAFLRLYRIGEYPSGLYVDEAYYGLYSLDVARGHFQLLFGDREPLFMYLVAAMVRLIGSGPLALRLTSALVGTLAVLTTYLAARSLFGRRAAAFAGATMATALWPLMISRIGFRAGTLPLVESAAIWLLWSGWQGRSLTRSALGGVFVALTLATYTAGRFFPIVLLAFAALAPILSWGWTRDRWRQVLASAVAAVVAFAPLGYYFLRHLDMFFNRTSEVAMVGGEQSAGGTLAALPANVLRTVGMFFTAGDGNWRHNLPSETAFLLPVSLVLVVGYAVAVARLRRPTHLFAAIGLPLMLAPSALSIDAPHYLRTLGAAPFAAALVGLGFAWLLGPISSLIGRAFAPMNRAKAGPAIAAVLLFALSLAPGIVTFRDYQVVWIARAEVQDAFDFAHAAVGRYLADSDLWRSGGQVYVARRFFDDRASITYFLWPYLTETERDNWNVGSLRLRWFDDERSLPLPASGPALYITGPRPDEKRLAAAGTIGGVQNVPPLGLAGFGAFTLAGAGNGTPPSSLVARGSAGLDLAGYDLGPAVASGSDAVVTLYWKVGEPRPAKAPWVFVHVLDENQRTVASSDQELGSAPGDWPAGGTILTIHRLGLPPGLPPGKYQVEAGLYDRESLKRQTLTRDGGSDSRVVIGALDVERGSATASDVKPQHSLARQVAPGLSLLGYDGDGASVAPGGSVPVTLYWSADSQSGDFAVELGLRGKDGSELRAPPVPPAGGRYPPTEWRSGEVVRDGTQLRIDPRAPAGDYSMYVRVIPRGGAAMVAVDLARVTVAGQARLFGAPSPREPASADFGKTARLVGFDLTDGSAKPAGAIKLRLYWQSLGDSSTSYTAFVHLLDSSDKVQGQRDSVPAAGARPTTGWVAGEYIVDEYEIPVADSATGTLRIEVGLYDPATGARLAVSSGDGKPIGDRYLLGPTISVQR